MTFRNVYLLAFLIVAGVVLSWVYYFGVNRETTGSSERRITRVAEGFKLRFQQMKSHDGEPPIRTSAEGFASIRPGADTFLVSIELDNLRSKERFNTHLHRGSCDRGGAGGLQLNPINSDETGTGTSETTVRFDELNPTLDHLIMVHNPENRHIVCADLPSIPRLKRTVSEGK